MRKPFYSSGLNGLFTKVWHSETKCAALHSVMYQLSRPDTQCCFDAGTDTIAAHCLHLLFLRQHSPFTQILSHIGRAVGVQAAGKTWIDQAARYVAVIWFSVMNHYQSIITTSSPTFMLLHLPFV